MADRVTLGKLRGIKLPPAKDKEEDHITSLRRTLETHKDTPDGVKICIPDSIADLLPEEASPEKPKKPDATLKS
jgi:hypothetical protein